MADGARCSRLNSGVIQARREGSLYISTVNPRNGVLVRATVSQSVDLGFISQVESYQKTVKNGIHSFPAWRSAQ